MKLVGYVRVSTESQVEEGLGLEVQRRALKQWAKGNGHRLVGIVADEGISGTKDVGERPGLAEALSWIDTGKAEALVVYRLDRLARSLNVQEAALGHVWKEKGPPSNRRPGGRVFAVDVGEILQDDPEDPMRTAMRQMMGVFAQLERGMIAARLRSGRRLKAEQGGYAYGAPPLGKKAVKVHEEKGNKITRELADDEAERKTLDRILGLRREGASVREIARTLEAEGHKPKRAHSRIKGKETSGKWNPGTLSRIIARLEGRTPKVA